MPAAPDPVTFISRISKMGNRLIIAVPSEYRDQLQKYHGKYVIVTVVPVEEVK